MSAPTNTLTAADLTPEHRGWLISWDLTWPEGVLGPSKREVELFDLRSWEYEGEAQVEVVSGTRGNLTGHHMPGTTPVRLVRPVTPKAKRAAKAAGWRDECWTWAPPAPPEGQS